MICLDFTHFGSEIKFLVICDSNVLEATEEIFNFEERTLCNLVVAIQIFSKTSRKVPGALGSLSLHVNHGFERQITTTLH